MKHIPSKPKKILFTLLLLSPYNYIYTNTAQPNTTTPAKQTQNKNTKQKKSGGFLWKFSTGFLTGIATMHVLQKTIMNNTHTSGKLCIYKQIQNLFNK